jgi:O-antigen/teichoic acid export membrane protein
MNRTKLLVKNTMIIAVGKIGTQLINFLLLPIYTTILSTAEYGVVDVISTLSMFLLPFVALQTEQALFRYLIDNRDDEIEKKRYISTVIFFQIIQITIFTFAFFVFKNFIQNDFKYFLLITVIIYTFSETLFQIARGLGKNSTYAIGGLIVSVSTIGFNILFIIFLKLGAAGILLSTIISNVLCIIFILLKEGIFKYISHSSIEVKVYRKVLKYSLPLVPNAISWWLVNASDRTLVLLFLGVSANGILSISHKFSTVFIMLYNIFNLTWMESISLHINDEDKEVFVSSIISNIVRIFTALCFGIISFMPFVFPYLINEKFSLAYYQIPIFMLAALFNVILASYSVIYIALKKTVEMAKTSLIAGIINVGFILLTIKGIGLYAASISSAVTYGILMIYRYHDVKKYLKISISKKLISSILLYCVIIFVIYYSGNQTFKAFNLIICIAYAIFINRSIIKQIIIMLTDLMKKHLKS